MFGDVTSLATGKPIPMIKVEAYRRAVLVDKAFTDDDGRYHLEVPPGSPVTIRFDTHHTLNNANDWHPSVVANLRVASDMQLDRMLTEVGHDADQESFVDALCGYAFALLWAVTEADEDFQHSAVTRLNTLKLIDPVLADIHARLIAGFST